MTVPYYEPPQLVERLAGILRQMGRAEQIVPLEDLAGLDQFHTGGLSATMRIGELLELQSDSHLLDVGSGLGGPARYLAKTSGCRVTGIDASVAFVDAATMLTTRTDVERQCTFQQADAMQLPFDDSTFDAAILLHVAMNIGERHRLYREISRVIKPGGRFCTYDVILRGASPDFPLPWASDPSTSFLRTEEATRTELERAGFHIDAWRIADPSIASTLGSATGGVPPLATVLGLSDFATRVGHLATALSDGRLGVLTALARKPATSVS